MAPIIPKASSSQRELPVGFDSLVALAVNRFFPGVLDIGRVLGGDLFDRRGKNVEVVNFT